MKKGSCLPNIFSQVIYSGGYSDGEPPLPIPNREAKPVIADGTARPGGRVGSRRAWKESSDERSSGDSFSCLQVCEEMRLGHSGFLRLEDVASVAPSIKVKILAQRKIPVDLHFIVRLRHKASGAALGLSCAVCFEQPAGVFAGCGAVCQAKILASLKIKNGISLTPLN